MYSTILHLISGDPIIQPHDPSLHQTATIYRKNNTPNISSHLLNPMKAVPQHQLSSNTKDTEACRRIPGRRVIVEIISVLTRESRGRIQNNKWWDVQIDRRVSMGCPWVSMVRLACSSREAEMLGTIAVTEKRNHGRRMVCASAHRRYQAELVRELVRE